MNLRDDRAVYWKEKNEHHLDVRPILEAGGEPYSVIMNAVGQVAPQESLHIHCLFDPLPLKKQLERMNFICHSKMIEADHWLVGVHSKNP
jgi:uncharacterized protein (DUF2249 family)